MKLYLSILAIAASILFTNCASLEANRKRIALNPKAAFVRFTKFIPSTERHLYDEIALVSCTLGLNYLSLKTNIQSCANKLKNQAHALGASSVLIKEKKVGRAHAYDKLVGGHYLCTNCVEVSGIVLKRKSKKKMSE